MASKYDWKTPGLYSVSADVAGAQIENLYHIKGEVNAADVVQVASNADNPLHSCFEWIDDIAAQKYREQQARVLIGNLVTVVVTDSNEESQPVRAFIHIRDKAESGYKPITVVVSDRKDTKYMLERAKAELQSFTTKYGALSELASLFKAIREVLGD